jgi:hypothetical protein
MSMRIYYLAFQQVSVSLCFHFSGRRKVPPSNTLPLAILTLLSTSACRVLGLTNACSLATPDQFLQQSELPFDL